VVINSSDGETKGTLVTTAHEELSTSAGRVLLVGSREDDFFLIGEILGRSQAALGAELDHVNSLQEPKDALGRNHYHRVLFEEETEARPSLVSA
jgi:hypothetical protein